MAETPSEPQPIRDTLENIADVIDTPPDEARHRAADDANLLHDASELSDKRDDAEKMLERGEGDEGVAQELRELEEPVADARREARRLTDGIE